MLFAFATMSLKLLYSQLENYTVRIGRLAFVQPTKPNYLIAFSDASMMKRDGLEFESLEIFEDGRSIDAADKAKQYFGHEKGSLQRIATSITEVQEDVKKFELKARASLKQ